MQSVLAHKKLAVLLICALLLQSATPAFIAKIQAAQLTEASIRLDRMGASVAASTDDPILVVFKPTTTATEGKLVITWPTTTAFTVNATAVNHTTTTTGLPTLYQGESLTAVPTLSSAASGVSGGAVTFTTGDLTAGTLYGFYITGGITNPSTSGTRDVTIATTTSADAVIDSSTVTVDITEANADQVSVTASVGSSFNFALGANTIALGELSTGTVDTGSVTVDIDSNAANGWVAFIRSEGASATFSSAIANYNISSTGTAADGTTTTASAGTENYLVDVAAVQGSVTSGTLTEAAEFAGNGTTTGGTLSTTYQQIAQSTGIADSDTLTLTALVAISALTAAGSDYTDTWEVVGAGNF